MPDDLSTSPCSCCFRRLLVLTRFVALLALGGLAPTASAEVVGIDVTRREVVAEGHAFGLAGRYEKLVGEVRYCLDPDHPGNARIVDLDLAPRDEEGEVCFAGDVYILKPVEPEKGNGTLLVEIPNRGGKASVRYFNRGARRTSDPTTREDFGDGFLMRRGFTVVWAAWQWDVPDRPELLRLDPVFVTASDRTGGEPVEGLIRADHVFSEPAQVLPLAHRNHRAYPVADPDDPRNVLTVRDSRLGERRVIPRSRWSFARLDDKGDDGGEVVPDRGHIHLPEGFEPGKIYEAVYVARDPAVVGLGLAAVRDLVSYLKHSPRSPAPGKRALAVGISQTGRFLRHFLYQGFNEDLEGRPALDGVLAQTAGAGRGSFNHRFGQPSRDAHPYSAFFYPTDIFPFTGRTQKDPATGLEDGLLRVLSDTRAMPKIFFTNTGYEYWGRAAGLIHTRLDGREDVEPLPDVRIYHFAGAQHFVDRFPPEVSGTRHPANPLNFFWALRGLLVALNDWITDGTEPPPSRFPRLADGTLTSLGELKFPAIPGVEVPGKAHEAYRADYGPRFRTEGVVTRQPPELGPAFPVRVPQVDADGNELGGLRLPEQAVPLATYTPWNWRAREIGAADELADFRGAFLPFPATEREREETEDPRPSVEERHANRVAYLGRTTETAVDLVRQRYLLAEDLPEMIDHAEELWALVAGDDQLGARSTRGLDNGGSGRRTGVSGRRSSAPWVSSPPSAKAP